MLGLLVYATLPIVFYPVLKWAVQTTHASEQLMHSGMILLFVVIFLIFEERRNIRLSCQHDGLSLGLLGAAFGLVIAQFFLPWIPLSLVAIALAVASIGHFLFGRSAESFSRALAITVLVFLLMALLLPVLDWPLRYYAGMLSEMILKGLGLVTSLHMITDVRPELVLVAEGRPFWVATECNGFGVLSASILLTTLLAIYKRLKLLDLVLALTGAVIVALIMNLVRIATIVILAPSVENYMLMHETVGVVCYYTALGFACWVVWSWPSHKRQEPHTESHNTEQSNA